MTYKGTSSKIAWLCQSQTYDLDECRYNP